MFIDVFTTSLHWTLLLAALIPPTPARPFSYRTTLVFSPSSRCPKFSFSHKVFFNQKEKMCVHFLWPPYMYPRSHYPWFDHLDPEYEDRKLFRRCSSYLLLEGSSLHQHRSEKLMYFKMCQKNITSTIQCLVYMKLKSKVGSYTKKKITYQCVYSPAGPVCRWYRV